MINLYWRATKILQVMPIVIDCDLQDPPELIINFIEKWEQGHDVVWMPTQEKKILSKNYFVFFLYFNENNTDLYPINAHGFRLIDTSNIILKY